MIWSRQLKTQIHNSSRFCRSVYTPYFLRKQKAFHRIPKENWIPIELVYRNVPSIQVGLISKASGWFSNPPDDREKCLKCGIHTQAWQEKKPHIVLVWLSTVRLLLVSVTNSMTITYVYSTYIHIYGYVWYMKSTDTCVIYPHALDHVFLSLYFAWWTHNRAGCLIASRYL